MLDEAAAEQAADHFAACVLMPRRVMRRCWRLNIRHPVALADLYDVSEHAVRDRLTWLGLSPTIEDLGSPDPPTASSPPGRTTR
jgi:Zn-dependent peptidase ImmA (M78 family)